MSLIARSAVAEWTELKLFGFVLFIMFLARFEKDSPWVLELQGNYSSDLK